MNKLWPFSRYSVQLLAVEHRYHQAGLSVVNQPIPWSAESVEVDAVLYLPPGVPRRRSDFTFTLPDGEPVLPATVSELDTQRVRATFSLAVPEKTVQGRVHHRGKLVGDVRLPRIDLSEFLGQLRLEMPTLSVRIGDDLLPCRSYVTRQGRGLLATAMLVSDVSLVPLMMLDPQVEFRDEHTGDRQMQSLRLTGSQLLGTTALLSAMPTRYPRRQGICSVRWRAGGVTLGGRRFRSVGESAFRRAVQVIASRFVVQQGDRCHFRATAPVSDPSARVGPCFVLTTGRKGLVGRCRVQLRGIASKTRQPVSLLEQEVLLSDAPTMIMPGTLNAGELESLLAFELVLEEKVIGELPIHSVPAATFTSEGGFEAPAEYTWNAVAEEEMSERLNRLLQESK